MASLTAIQSDASKVFGHLRQSGFEAKEGHPCWMELGETLKETKIPKDTRQSEKDEKKGKVLPIGRNF